MSNDKTILILNPGSTLIKVGIFSAGEMKLNVSIKYAEAKLKKFATFWDQYDFLRDAILQVLNDNNLSMGEVDAIACCGDNVMPMPGGTCRIYKKMIDDMKSDVYSDSHGNVGGLVAFDLGDQFNIPVLTASPPRGG